MKFEIYGKMGSVIKRSGFSQDPLTFISLLLIFIIGAYLRLHELGKNSLWYDETASIFLAMEDVLVILQIDLLQPLHKIFIHFALYLGENEFIIRLPSAIMGISGIPLLYIVGKEFFGKKEGIVASFLMSVSVFHLVYSQEARAYAAMVFFSLLTLHFYWKLIKYGYSKRWLGGFIIATVLNILNHSFALMVLLIQLIFLLLLLFIEPSILKKFEHYFLYFSRGTNKREKTFWTFIFVILIFIIFFYFINALKHLEEFGYGSLLGGARGLKFSNDFVIYVLSLFGTIDNGMFVYLVFFIIGIAVSIKKHTKQILLCSLLIFIPFILLFTLKFDGFFPRRIIFILPIYLLVVSRGLVKFLELLSQSAYKNLSDNARLVFTFLIALIIFGSINISPIKGYYEKDTFLTHARSDWKGIYEYIKDNGRSEDIIFFDDHSILFYTSDYDTKEVFLPNAKTPLGVKMYLEKHKEVDFQNHRYIFPLSTYNLSFAWFAFFYDVEKLGGPIEGKLAEFIHLGRMDYFKHASLHRFFFIEKLYFDDFSADKYLTDAYEIENLVRDKINKHLRPVEYGREASITYRIAFAKPIDSLYIEPWAYVLYKNNYIKVYISTDGQNYTLLREIKEPSVFYKYGTEKLTIDASNEARGHATVYIKIKMYVDKETSVTLADVRLEKLKIFVPRDSIPKGRIFVKEMETWDYSEDFSTVMPLVDSFYLENIGIDARRGRNGFIQPFDPRRPGKIVYKLESEDSIDTMEITLLADIRNENDYIELQIGPSLDSISTFRLNDITGGTEEKVIDVTQIAKGHKSVFIGTEIYIHQNERILWGTKLRGIKISTEFNRSYKTREESNFVLTPNTLIQIKDGSLEYIDDFHTSKYAEDTLLSDNISHSAQDGIIYPTKYNSPATLVYKFESPAELKKLFIKASAYVVYDNNYLKIYASPNGVNYTLLRTIEGTSFSPSHGTKDYVLDATGVVRGSDMAFVKIEMYVNGNTSVTLADSRLEEIKIVGSLSEGLVL